MDSKQKWRMTLQRSQVNKVLRKMKSGKSYSGPDKLPVEVWAREELY